eukprot:4913481-Pleurochrysis_carterae.AAC.1
MGAQRAEGSPEGGAADARHKERQAQSASKQLGHPPPPMAKLNSQKGGDGDSRHGRRLEMQNETRCSHASART